MTSTLLVLALAAAPTTKLGVYVAGDDATSQALLDACPPVAVFPLSTAVPVPAAQIAAFRSACPGSNIIAQVGDWGMTVDASSAANYYWNVWLQLLQEAGFANIDAVEGPPEPFAATAADLASFWMTFADAVQSSIGRKPIVGSLPTMTPTSDFCPTAAAMMSRQYAWAWSYHALSTSLTQTLSTEAASTFGYRSLSSGCGVPGLTAVPVYLTQLGPYPRGSWQSGDVSWLAWVDAQLAQDPEVVAAAVYEAGGSDRSLEPIAPDLAAYLQNPAPADGGVPDGGTDGGTGGVVSPGGIIPSGPPGNYASSGCGSAGAGAGLALLALGLVALARRIARKRGA